MVETEELQRTVFSRVPKQKQTNKKPRASLHKIDSFFLYVWVCVCVFNISPSVAAVSPPSVSAQLKHSHRAYFVIDNHTDFIWKKVYVL